MHDMDTWPRWLTLGLAPILAVQASAQPPGLDPLDYAPLDIGNRWEYVYQDDASTPATPLYYVVAEVEGETMIVGEPYRVLAQQKVSLDGVPTGPRARCAYSLTAGAASADAAGFPDYDCSILPVPPPLPFSNGPTTVTAGDPYDVNGQTYTADSLVSYSQHISGSGGQYVAQSWRHVKDVGRIESRAWGQQHTSNCTTSPSTCTYSNRTRLVFAQVGGAVYGASVVARGEELESRPLKLQAWPNPADGPQFLRMSGASGPATVTAYDAQGRQVWRGELTVGSLTLPLVAPGIYTLRVIDSGGRRTSMRVVRL